MQTLKEEMNSFGERLRCERERMGLTQDHFGSLGGVTRLTQSKYESGESSPNVDYLMKIEAYGVDVNLLMNGGARNTRSMEDVTNENADLFSSIVEELETAIIINKVQLSPAKRAQLVAMIYRNNRGVLPVDKRLVSDLLLLASS